MLKYALLALGASAIAGCAMLQRDNVFPDHFRCKQQARPAKPSDGSITVVFLGHAETIELTNSGGGAGKITLVPTEFDYLLQGYPIRTWAAHVEEKSEIRRFTTIDGELSFSVLKKRTALSGSSYEGRDDKRENDAVWLNCR